MSIDKSKMFVDSSKPFKCGCELNSDLTPKILCPIGLAFCEAYEPIYNEFGHDEGSEYPQGREWYGHLSPENQVETNVSTSND